MNADLILINWWKQAKEILFSLACLLSKNWIGPQVKLDRAWQSPKQRE